EKVADTNSTEKVADTNSTEKVADTNSTEKVADTNSTEKVADTNNTDVCKMPPCPEGKVCIQVCPESIGKNIINSSN
ncbi:MAG: hypothetical protein ACPKPY_00295, partial [Nitrososphaeraceae archaeon]